MATGKKHGGRAPPDACLTDPGIIHPLQVVLLFKRILDFQKSDGGLLDKRGAKRYPVGAKYPLKARITLIARDGEGHPMPPEKHAPMDWGGQLLNLSASGASMRLHPAAVAARGEACTLKLELDHMLFEVECTVASYRTQSQYVSVGIANNFPDSYTRKAYQQLMEPVVIGSTLAEYTGRVKQDLPGLEKEQYNGESDSVLSVWTSGSGKTRAPKLFELLVHDYYIRGNTELPGLKIGYRDGAQVGKRVSTPAIPIPMSREHQAEVTRLFRFVVENLTKAVPSEIRKFLEQFVA
ncbi:MAG: hypothetical protein WDM96_09440 [Lacunisphaera sp.]